MKNKILFLLTLAGAVLAACANAPAKSAEITLDATAIRYQPAMIEVIAGQPVKLTFRNNDTMEHDFSIMEIPVISVGPTQAPRVGHDMGGMTDEPQLHMATLMGQSATLEFTPTKPGTYEFFCTVAGHKEAGMKGSLIVKSP